VSVRHLELADFRIFRGMSIDLEAEGTTVITGSNGTGKTSVLEALAYLGIRRSFRRRAARRNGPHGCRERHRAGRDRQP